MRAHTEESVEDGYTRENEDRKQDGKAPTRHEKYWAESGRGDEQGDVENRTKIIGHTSDPT